MSGFSCVKLEAGRNELGLCTARDESKSCFCVLSRPLAELEGIFYPDHVRFHSCHPYIDRRSNNKYYCTLVIVSE